MRKEPTPITDPDEIRKILGPHDATRRHAVGWSAVGGPRSDEESPSSYSLVLFCSECGHNTSGIYEKPTDEVRRCPACHSILMYCTVCKSAASATEKFSVLVCDRCSANFVTNTTLEYLASKERQSRDIILSGIRATGDLHLGNYFGAVQQFVNYERGDNFCMYFIADWHTLTTCHDPKAVALRSVAVATDYLAAGLNPERSIIYTQSSVPEIAELALYLAMVQSKNQVEDLPTVKDLVRRGEAMSMGHLSYPILMAADILGPKATLVPVGEDQVSNVELARKLAEKLNREFGTRLVVPRMSLNPVVPGLTGRKMAKSDEEESVTLGDTLEAITNKYLQYGVTDIGRKTRKDPGNPDNCVSVYPLHQILYANRPDALRTVATECRSALRGCTECKRELAWEIDAFFQPFRERRAALAERRKYVIEVLHFGGMKAREVIRPTVEEVREKLGIISV